MGYSSAMQLDPTSLRLFVRVVEEGTIARAAAREHIAAAAVSKRISEIEDALRTQLLIRSNKGVEPSAAGRVLLRFARSVLHDLDRIYIEMRDYAAGTRGHVRICANISATAQFLPFEIAAFLRAHPGVQIQLEEKISSAVIEAVAENAADIGICNKPEDAPGVEILTYHSHELVLATPVDHPLAAIPRVRFSDALPFDFVGLHTGSSINLLLTRAAMEAGRHLKMRIQVTNWGALCRMIEAGLGIGVLPRYTAQPYVDTGRIRALALDEPWVRRELCICVRNLHALPAAVRLLVEHLRDQR